MNILVKISGDLVYGKPASDFIQSLASKKDKKILTLIVGGGTQITQALKREGLDVPFENGVRVHQAGASRSVARDSLDKNYAVLKDHFRNQWNVHLVSPYHMLGGFICHFNADDYLRLLAPNFDEAYCLTKKGRVKHFPSVIKVVEFE